MIDIRIRRVDPGHTQASPRTGELLVEYFVTDERSTTFVVSPSAFKLIEQPIARLIHWAPASAWPAS